MANRKNYPLGKNGKKAFSLIEMMVVVGILSILASFASSVYQHYLVESKSAEATLLLSKISDLESQFYLKPRTHPRTGAGMNPCFISATASPAIPSAYKQPWVDTSGNFTKLGFAPADPVYFTYVASNPTGDFSDCQDPVLDPGVAAPSSISVSAGGDLDGDGVLTVLGMLSEPAYGIAIPLCPAVGVLRTIPACPFGSSCALVRNFFTVSVNGAPGSAPNRTAVMVGTFTEPDTPNDSCHTTTYVRPGDPLHQEIRDSLRVP